MMNRNSLKEKVRAYLYRRKGRTEHVIDVETSAPASPASEVGRVSRDFYSTVLIAIESVTATMFRLTRVEIERGRTGALQSRGPEYG